MGPLTLLVMPPPPALPFEFEVRDTRSERKLLSSLCSSVSDVVVEDEDDSNI